ncbi:MAG: hypothetical protein V1793_17310 [Pseudomonadota bacterium]
MEFTDPVADSIAIASEIGPFDELKIKKTLEYGCPLVIETLWERLGIKKALNKAAKSKDLRIKFFSIGIFRPRII